MKIKRIRKNILIEFEVVERDIITKFSGVQRIPESNNYLYDPVILRLNNSSPFSSMSEIIWVVTERM